MKKKILIVSSVLWMWGVEKALFSLVKSIPSDKYDVSLCLVNKNDEYVKSFPKDVDLLNVPFKKEIDASLWMNSAIKWELNKGNYCSVMLLLVGYIVKKFFNSNCILKNFLFKDQDKEFDYIFNFRWPSIFTSIISEDVFKWRKKYIWIHNDFFSFVAKKSFLSKCIMYFKRILYKNIFKYDYVFCVSNEIRDRLKSVYKNLNNVETLYNIIDKKLILDLWNKKWFVDDFSWLKILSVWRLVHMKWFDIAVEVFSKLKKKYKNIRWYVIWNWYERDKLLCLIKKYNLEHDFLLLGEKNNPYPYMKSCDLYVQTSRVDSFSSLEGFCLTIAEAKIFNLAIVSTVFPWAKEQLYNYSKWVLVNFCVDDILFAMENMISCDFLKDYLPDLKKDKTLSSSFVDLEKYL